MMAAMLIDTVASDGTKINESKAIRTVKDLSLEFSELDNTEATAATEAAVTMISKGEDNLKAINLARMWLRRFKDIGSPNAIAAATIATAIMTDKDGSVDYREDRLPKVIALVLVVVAAWIVYYLTQNIKPHAGQPPKLPMRTNLKPPSDQALNGGIDFNSANLNLQIKRNGRGVPLPLSQQDMAQLSRIQGFIPEITEIESVVNLPILIELRQRLQ